MTGSSFLAKLNRLKACLGVSEDQEAAEALGLTKAALSLRKQRGSFPDDRLFVLAANRPELDLDVTYVLTGNRSVRGLAHQHIETQARVIGSLGPLSDEVADLVAHLVTDRADRLVKLRKQRAKEYDLMLLRMDYMSDSSLSMMLAIAERVAAADMADEISRGRSVSDPSTSAEAKAPVKKSAQSAAKPTRARKLG